MNTVQIPKDYLHRMGSLSLLGMISTKFPPSEVLIQFEQTTIGWKHEHGGPDEVIVPEYFPVCLCDDILSLIKCGYTVTIGEYNIPPTQ